MIRRLLDFTFILIFVWAFMLSGLWVIDKIVVPSELLGSFGNIASGIIRVSISATLVLLWLWTWREIVKRTFWRIIKQQRNTAGNQKRK